MSLLPYTLTKRSKKYPASLRREAATADIQQIWMIGNREILNHSLLGFFCSAKCPGDVILRTYDVARALRDGGVPVIGGFHSPMEKECLDLLLRGKQPIVICPARGIQRMRIPAAWRTAIEENRLLIASPFEEKYSRATVPLAEQRNRFCAALAHELFVTHAGAGSKTERFCLEQLGLGTTVYVLRAESNDKQLAKDGAKYVTIEGLLKHAAHNQHP